MKQGVWGFSELLNPKINNEHRKTLGEGMTPLEENYELSSILNIEKIYLKREDLNPTGSHKDRGVAFQISAHLQEGKKEFAISSSGNSAISAIHILKNTNYKLDIFLSSNISISKIQRLTKTLKGNIPEEIFKGKNITYENITFHFSKKPLSELTTFVRKNNVISLRGSTDKYGYEGFKTIGYELEKIKADSIFIPTSSGTTAKGIYEGLKEKNIVIPFHIIQTTKINTMVHRFDKNYKPSITSKADAIVDRIGHRVNEIEEIINKTKGTGWIISDKEIEESQNILKKVGIQTSNESALTIAGIIKAKKNNWEIKKPICIFTGTI